MAQNPYAQTGPYDSSGADFGVPIEPARTSVRDRLKRLSKKKA